MPFPPDNPDWLLEEDAALKEKLQNQIVFNYSDGRQIPVPVFFRFPDSEIRQRTFPHIAIDLVDILPAADRTHRAAGPIVVNPLEQATPLTGFTLVANDMALPWSLIYQLATYARQPYQDRQMQAAMLMNFPNQFGFLDMTNFDGTTRRADLQSAERADTVDTSNNRLYRNIYTVAISSQFYLDQVQQIKDVLTTDITAVVAGPLGFSSVPE